MHDAVSRWNRPRLDDLLQRAAVPGIEDRLRPRRLACRKTFRPIRVEAHHPVPHDLPRHAANDSRITSAGTIQDRRNRQKTAHLRTISAAPGMRPKIYPASIRVDQGSEFISRKLDLWAYMKGVTLDFSRPGKPTDNAFIESFNGKFRADCLNQHWFMSLDDAVRKCEAWLREYNEVRPHSAIGNKPPISLMLASAAHGPP